VDAAQQDNLQGVDARAGGTLRQATPRPLRHLFDWLVNGQIVPVNPAHGARAPARRDVGPNLKARVLSKPGEQLM
jgi:hypothetical protein